MDLTVVDDYAAFSRTAAEMLAQIIAANPAATVLVATGDTPMGPYQALAALARERGLDVSRLRVFQLDEYLGLAPDDRRSLYGWMCRTFVDPLGIPAGNVVRLPGDAADPAAACHAYDEAIRAAGGIDLAILGLGPNGHLGFNEPPVDADAPTRVVSLTPESIASNGCYWGDAADVPRQALTAGMTVLLAARQTLLLVAGAHKREILHRTIAGPVTPEVPASWLHRAAHVTCLADRAACGEDAVAAPTARPTGSAQE